MTRPLNRLHDAEQTDPVLKTRHADSENLQQLVELRGGHVHSPALDKTPVGILHHPQEAHQQVTAGVCRQGGYRLPLLGQRGRCLTQERGKSPFETKKKCSGWPQYSQMFSCILTRK